MTRERNVSKHELWQLCGDVAAKCEGLAAILQRACEADLAAALAIELRRGRGPNPAERIPPRGNAVGGRKSAAKRKDGAR